MQHDKSSKSRAGETVQWVNAFTALMLLHVTLTWQLPANSQSPEPSTVLLKASRTQIEDVKGDWK